MRARKVISAIHGAITLILLITVMVFLWLNHSTNYRDNDTLLRSQKINQNLWLYTTKNDSGGVTVPVIYRYFLAGKLTGNNQDILLFLKKQIPFLEGEGSISAITQDAGDSKVTVVYSGKVMSVDNVTSYRLNEKNITVQLAYQIN